jgi:hypothetical protein
VEKSHLRWQYNYTSRCLEAATSGASYKIFEMFSEKYCAQRIELNDSVLILGRFRTIGEAVNICSWDSENLI